MIYDVIVLLSFYHCDHPVGWLTAMQFWSASKTKGSLVACLEVVTGRSTGRCIKQRVRELRRDRSSCDFETRKERERERAAVSFSSAMITLALQLLISLERSASTNRIDGSFPYCTGQIRQRTLLLMEIFSTNYSSVVFEQRPCMGGIPEYANARFLFRYDESLQQNLLVVS